MKMQEQEAIKAYLINYINTLWNTNRDLVAVFGRDFAKNQLEQNLREIKFNGNNIVYSGEFNLATKDIYVYNSENPIYTFADFMQSPIKEELTLTLIHEMLHSIFSKNLNTEPDIKKRTTGLEIYDEAQGMVINFAFNEGYTDYINGLLSGRKETNYTPYVKVFQILEKKLGRQGVIALNKGDVAQNLADAFNITKPEFMEFCRYSQRKFINERKLGILENKYCDFCDEYPEGTEDSEETKKAILKFDNEIHKSLYGVSIMGILPLEEGETPTLEQFHDFLIYKIDSIHEHGRKFHQNLAAIAEEACIGRGKNTFLKVMERNAVLGSNTVPDSNNQVGSNDRHNAFVSLIKSMATINNGRKHYDERSYLPYNKDSEELDL